jgi:hypothetical protein
MTLGVFADLFPAKQDALVTALGAMMIAAIWVSILRYLVQWW